MSSPPKCPLTLTPLLLAFPSPNIFIPNLCKSICHKLKAHETFALASKQKPNCTMRCDTLRWWCVMNVWEYTITRTHKHARAGEKSRLDGIFVGSLIWRTVNGTAATGMTKKWIHRKIIMIWRRRRSWRKRSEVNRILVRENEHVKSGMEKWTLE